MYYDRCTMVNARGGPKCDSQIIGFEKATEPGETTIIMNTNHRPKHLDVLEECKRKLGHPNPWAWVQVSTENGPIAAEASQCWWLRESFEYLYEKIRFPGFRLGDAVCPPTPLSARHHASCIMHHRLADYLRAYIPHDDQPPQSMTWVGLVSTTIECTKASTYEA